MAAAAAMSLPGPVVEYPDELQCVDLQVLPNKVCAKAHPQKVTDVMMCVGHLEGGKDTCAVSTSPFPPQCPTPAPHLSMLGGRAWVGEKWDSGSGLGLRAIQASVSKAAGHTSLPGAPAPSPPLSFAHPQSGGGCIPLLPLPCMYSPGTES